VRDNGVTSIQTNVIYALATKGKGSSTLKKEDLLP